MDELAANNHAPNRYVNNIRVRKREKIQETAP